MWIISRLLPQSSLCGSTISPFSIMQGLHNELWGKSTSVIRYYSERVPAPRYWAPIGRQMPVLEHNFEKLDAPLPQINIVSDLPIGIVRVKSRVPTGRRVFIERPEYKALISKIIRAESQRSFKHGRLDFKISGNPGCGMYQFHFYNTFSVFNTDNVKI